MTSYICCLQSMQLWFQVSTNCNSSDSMMPCTLSLWPLLLVCGLLTTLSRQCVLGLNIVAFTVFQYICAASSVAHVS